MNILRQFHFLILLIALVLLSVPRAYAQATLGCTPANISNVNFCENSVITYQASVIPGVITNYSWQLSDLSNNIIQTGNQSSFTINGFPRPNELYLFVVSADSAGIPVQRVFGFIPVDPSPAVDLGSDIILCPNQTATLASPSSPVGGTYVYSWTSLPNTTLAGGTTISVSSPGQYQLNVRNTNNGCNRSDVVSVVTKNKPEISAISKTGFPFRCNGEALGLDVSVSTQTELPYTYSWSPSFAISSTTAKDPNVTNSIPQTYTVIMTDVNNCSDTSSIFVRVNPPLSITTSFSDSIVCKFNSVSLINTPIGGTIRAGSKPYRYAWSPSIGLNDSTAATPLASPLSVSGITYSVTLIDSNNCTASDTVRIRKANLEMALRGYDTDSIAICRFASLQLGATRKLGSAPFTYSWLPTAYVDLINDSTIFTKPIDQDVTLYVTITDGKTCTDKDSLQVTIINAALPNVPNNPYLCAGSDTVFNVTPLVGEPSTYRYAWSPSIGLSNTTTASPIVTAGFAAGPTVYGVTVLSTITNCAASANFTLDTKALPTTAIAEPTGPVYFKDAVSLSASSAPELGYVWKIQDYANQIGGSVTQVFDSVKTYRIILMGTDNFGCIGSDTLDLRVNAFSRKKIYVPNVFSPNASNTENTTFRVFVEDSDVDVNAPFEVKVFSRTGQLVYQTSSFREMKTFGWDGSGYSSGVYTYIINWTTSNGEKMPTESGRVTLLK